MGCFSNTELRIWHIVFMPPAPTASRNGQHLKVEAAHRNTAIFAAKVSKQGVERQMPSRYSGHHSF
jgi:hypothetical protein